MFSPIKPAFHRECVPNRKSEKQLSKLVQIYHRYSFAYQVKEHRALQTFAEVCVLIGTSTAGKTSIIKALLAKEPGRVEKGLDLCEMENMRHYLQSHHPEEFAFLQSILVPKQTGIKDLHVLDAVGPKIFAFKNGVSEQDQKKAQEIAEELFKHLIENVKDEDTSKNMMEEVLYLSVCGQATVFDIMEVEEVVDYALQRGYQAPIKIALVYCPFAKMGERIIERNRKALANKEYHEFRGAHPLFQFAKYFKPKRNNADFVTETITRKMVEDSFDTCFNMEMEFMREMDPRAYAETDFEKDRKEAKDLLLMTLGFTDLSVDTVELTPKSKRFDFLIDTSQTTPEQSADILTKPGEE